MDVNQIRELIKAVEASDISEIVIEEGEAKVTVRRGGFAAPALAASFAAAPVESGSAGQPALVAPAPGERPAEWKTVVAPMVGTFYAAPAPGSPPFVVEGDSFVEGQPLCILEAMKLMNEIPAEEAGVIREIVTANGELCEFGTVLFYYEPA